MTLAETVQGKLTELRTASREVVSWADPDSGWSCRLTAERVDGLGCSLWDCTLQGPISPVHLQPWASSLAARATGLLESLALLEVDTQLGTALLRSDPPTQNAGLAEYYEMFLKTTGEATLCRFHASHTAGRRRQQIAFTLTHESLVKLVRTVIESRPV